jgi:hypothetical protein
MSKTEIGEFGQPHDVRHGDVSYWRAAEVEEREIVQRLQRGQFGIANCSYGDRQSLELCETPHVFEHSVGFKAGKPDGRDVTEEVSGPTGMVDTFRDWQPSKGDSFPRLRSVRCVPDRNLVFSDWVQSSAHDPRASPTCIAEPIDRWRLGI